MSTIETSWTIDLTEGPLLPPIRIGKTVIVPTTEDRRMAKHSTLRAYNAEKGEPTWNQTVEFSHVSSLLAYKQDGIIPMAIIGTRSSDVLHGNAKLWAVDERGKTMWEWEGEGSSFSELALEDHPLLSDDLICLTVSSKSLVTLMPSNGDEKHNIPIDAPLSKSAPALNKGVAYLPCRGPKVIAVDLKSQKTLWTYEEEGRIWFDKTPVVMNETLIATSSHGIAVALDTKTGAVKWRIELGKPGKPLSPPAFDNQRIYIGSRTGLHAINPADGSQIWELEYERGIVSQPVVQGEMVVVTCMDHLLRTILGENGTVFWEYPFARRMDTAPVVATDTQLLAVDYGGRLTAFNHEFKPEDIDEGPQTMELPKDPAELRSLARELEDEEDWAKAAEVWLRAGRYIRYAHALEEYAHSLSDNTDVTDEERADAWERAAEAFEGESEHEQAGACRREVARFRKLPVITLDVSHQGLVLNEWTQLDLKLHNQGFGQANLLTIRAVKSGQFDGSLTNTLAFPYCRPGQKQIQTLDVLPKQAGRSVPLRLSIDFLDDNRKEHQIKTTVYLAVARSHEENIGGEQMGNVLGNASNTRSLGTTNVSSGGSQMRRRLLVSCQEFLSLDQLKQIAFVLDIDTEELSPQKTPLIMDMIRLCSSNGLLDDFIDQCKEINDNPDAYWNQVK